MEYRMACEIELKVSITKEEYAILKEDFSDRMSDLGYAEKKDMYLRKEGYTDDNLRLREAAGKWTLTYKERSTDEGIEVNKEIELEIVNGNDVYKFLEVMGFQKSFEKVKKVHRFEMNRIKYELVEVPKLGTFLEIEVILENEEDLKKIAVAKKKVKDALMSLNITSKTIEERSYKSMLGHN
jgi:predicted adenylyl cyclase CyaB